VQVTGGCKPTFIDRVRSPSLFTVVSRKTLPTSTLGLSADALDAPPGAMKLPLELVH
jgi:hypothetical protein